MNTLFPDTCSEKQPVLPDWLQEARAHLREHYPHDGLSESCLWALYAAGFGIVGDIDIDAA